MNWLEYFDLVVPLLEKHPKAKLSMTGDSMTIEGIELGPETARYIREKGKWVGLA